MKSKQHVLVARFKQTKLLKHGEKSSGFLMLPSKVPCLAFALTFSLMVLKQPECPSTGEDKARIPTGILPGLFESCGISLGEEGTRITVAHRTKHLKRQEQQRVCELSRLISSRDETQGMDLPFPSYLSIFQILWLSSATVNIKNKGPKNIMFLEV